MNPQLLFSSYKDTVHVPSFYLQKILYPENIEEGISFLFHPYSLSFIESSLEEAQIIKMVEMGLSLEKIKELKGEQAIKTIYEVKNIIKDLKPKEVIRFNKPTVLWLLTSPYCNLRCRYCYTGSGTVFRSSTRLLDVDEVIKAVHKILETFPTINHISFFGGGEPLLRLDIIEKVTKTFDKYVNFSIVTNATLINNKFIDILLSYRDKFHITVSIDGPKIVNDINRIYPDDKGTFDEIIRGINLLKDNDIMFDIQATYTKEALDLGYSITDIARFLSKLSPYIMIKPSDYVLTLKAGMRFDDSMLGYLLADYVSESIKELSTSSPGFYDLVVAINVAQIGRKAVKLDACPFTSFITLNADGRLLTCHMLMDLPLGNVTTVSSQELLSRYNKALSILSKYSNMLDPRIFWMLTLQDICPAELFNGISNLLRTKQLIPRYYIRSTLESYWDSLLIEIFKAYRRGKLNAIYDNIVELLRVRRGYRSHEY